MKIKVILIAAALLAAGTAMAADDHAVKGYTKKDGTYVPPHRATNPNATETDNYSSKGNTNPSTGKEGTKTPKK